jgi:hypothetical protein
MSDTTQKNKGAFKTKTKFVEFIGGKGYVNFLSNEAYIMGNQLSGLEMDGIKFKLTICDDFTVDFDEVDTNFTTESQRARLVEIIEDKTISSYRGRSVVHELDFKSTQKVKDKYVSLYLAVEISKPIDKLVDILDSPIKPTQNALSNLDLLFDDEESVEEIEYTTEHPSELDNQGISQLLNGYMQSLEDSFTKMKEDKLKELKSNLDKKEKELNNLKYQLTSTEKNIDTVKSDIKLIEDRIEDLQPTNDPLGYFFNVSERQNETVTLEPEIEKIIRDKVSKVKGINTENFMKLFTDGEFIIKLGKKVGEDINIITDFKEIEDSAWSMLYKLNTQLEDDKIIYRGELTWSQIVNKMIKLGFEENAEFNKLCGSNSYESKTLQKEEIVTTKNTF